MVEFDDGDRGRISLHNIRLLPPGYQVQCESLIFSHRPVSVVLTFILNRSLQRCYHELHYYNDYSSLFMLFRITF